MFKSFATLLAFVSCNCFAGPVDFPGPQGQYAVGLRVVQLRDRSRTYAGKVDLVSGLATTGERARPIQALVWYPAEKTTGVAMRYHDYLRMIAKEEHFKRSDAEVDQAVVTWLADNYPGLDRQATGPAMLARRDARAASGPFPVVVYAPGSSAAASDNADLCEYLASHGYLVVASASVGVNTRSMTLDLDGAEAGARDISFLVGYASALPNADGAHVAAMGYSFGGLSNVLAAATDDRIAALVSLDGSVRYYPAVVQKATYALPERLALPMLYLGAKPYTAEQMNRYKQVPTTSLMNEMTFAELYNVTMYTMEHAAFQSEALRLAPEQRFGEYTRTDALTAHGWMGRYVRAFLDAYLRGDAAGLAFMQARPAANGVPAHLLALDVHHAEGDPPTLTTLAARFARSKHRDLAGVYQDMRQRAPAFKPDERALISWGEQFLDLNRTREAIEIYQLTTTLYPGSARALYYLAMAFDKNHDTALAIAAYQRVLLIWPDMLDARQNIDRLEASGKLPPKS
jgi:dienelactone hydrolase